MRCKQFIPWFMAAALSVAFAQKLELSPTRALVDEEILIRATGLRPKAQVRMEAALIDGAGRTWHSAAEFAADARGVVDLSKQAPRRGSYSTVSPMGLIWSMHPSPDDALRYVRPKNNAAQTITFSLVQQGRQLAAVTFEQTVLGAGVRPIIVREDGLRGTLFLPATPGPRPAVLVLSGSTGGLPETMAAWVASRGFAALALAYFNYDDLPQRLDAIPLEYFERALNLMAKHPEIRADRVAVMGFSRGGELVLQLGSMFPRIRAVVAYVPSHVRWGAGWSGNQARYLRPAWTWKGDPLPYMRSVPDSDLPDPVRLQNAKGIYATWFSHLLDRQPDMERQAGIPVEKIQGPLLLISGMNDGLWPSSQMSDAVVRRLNKHGFKFDVEHLRYPNSGHFTANPGITPTWRHPGGPHPSLGFVRDFGGTAEGEAASILDAMPKVLRFLSRSLE